MKRFWGKIVTLVFFLTLAAQVFWTFAQGNDDILAKVGNDVITRLDYETRLKSLPPAAQRELGKDPAKQKVLLDGMVNGRLLVLEGESRGLMEKPEVKAGLRMQRDDFITQEYVQAYLESKAEVSDEEAEKEYQSSSEIREREYLKVSQIVVAKEEEGKEILEKLKKGEIFKKMVKERSIDPATREKGGELEWFEKGKGIKEFEEALLKVEKGGISDVVRFNGKYYILQLDERRIIPKPPFGKVRDDLVTKLKYKKISELAAKEVDALWKKVNVEAFYQKLSTEGK